MITPELESYIKSEVTKGTPIEVIKSNLEKGGGWLESEINQALNSTLGVKNNNIRTLTVGGKFLIGLIVVTNIILFFVIIYTTLNAEPAFNSSGALAKSFLGLGAFFFALPLSIITVIVGYVYWFRKKIPQIGIPLLLLGLFMFPPLGIRMVLNIVEHDTTIKSENNIETKEDLTRSTLAETEAKTQENTLQQVGAISEKDQLFNVYIEATNLLQRRNMQEIFSYLRILNQYKPSDSFEIDLEHWQKYPQEFYTLIDQATDLLGSNFITKEKFISGQLRSEGNMTQVSVPAKQEGSVHTLFFVKINNNWYLLLPIV